MCSINKRLRNNNNIKANDEVFDENDGNESIVKQIVDKHVLNGKVEYRVNTVVSYSSYQWIDKQSLGFQQMIDSYEQSLRDNNEVIDKNELIQINTDYKRDSFDDRVCDDLSEVLLSYLSFEDKFGFECISKQWKSLIFNKQKKLYFNDKNMGLFIINEKFNFYAFEDIMKKCKRIDSIDIDFGYNINNNDKQLLLKKITKHCNGLKSIRYDFNGIDMKTIESFGHKFGNSLQVLENLFPQSIKHINTSLKFCYKLVSIKGISIGDMFDNEGNLLLTTNKLERFYIKIEFNCVKQFENFIDKYKQTIKVLSIKFLRKELMDIYLNQLSEILNLKNLELNFNHLYFDNFFNSFDNSLALISEKCKNLEKLSFIGYCFSYSPQIQLITRFNQLKYLSIDSYSFSDEKYTPISVKAFKDFKCLTHLTVLHLERGDDFFIDIDQYLPQLTVLKVSYDFPHTDSSHLTDLTFNHLSKLTNIQILEIHKELIFKFKAFEQFINSCKNINSIKLFGNKRKQHFTKKTIDSLISLAVKRPEIQFKLNLNVSENMLSYYNKLLNKPINIDITKHNSFYSSW